MSTQTTEGQLTTKVQNSHTSSMSEGDILFRTVVGANNEPQDNGNGKDTGKSQEEKKPRTAQEVKQDVDKRLSEYRNVQSLLKRINTESARSGELISGSDRENLAKLLSGTRQISRELALLMLDSARYDSLPENLKEEIKSLSKDLRLARRDLEHTARRILTREGIGVRLSGSEYEIGKVPAPLVSQVISEFAKFTTGESSVREERESFILSLKNKDGKTVEVPISKSGSIEDLSIVVKHLIDEGFVPKDALSSLKLYARQLKQAALLLEQGNFAPEVVEFIYNTGKHLEVIVGVSDDRSFTAYEEIQKEARNHPLSEAEQKEVYLKILLGKDSSTVFYKDKNGVERVARNPYQELFRYWKKREEGRNWKDDPKYTGAKTEQEAYEMWLMDTRVRGKILSVFKRFIERGFGEDNDKALSALNEGARRTVGEAPLFVQVEQFRELFEEATGRTGKRVIDRAIKAGENAGKDPEKVLQAITNVFQPEKTGTLEHVPKKVLEQVGQGDGSFEAGCAVLSTIAKEAYEKNGFIVLPHLSGNHVNLVVAKKEGNQWRIYEVDPSVPQDKEGAVKEITELPLGGKVIEQLDSHGVNSSEQKPTIDSIRLTVKDGNITHVVSGGDRVLVSSFLTNLVATRFEDPDLSKETKIAIVKEAIRVCPDNAVAYKFLERLYGKDSPEGRQYGVRARSIDPSAEARVIGTWAGDSGFDPAKSPQRVAGVITDTEKALAAMGPNAKLSDLPESQLGSIAQSLQSALSDPNITSNPEAFEFVRRRLDEVGGALGTYETKRSQAQQQLNRQLQQDRDDRLPLFSISPAEQEILQTDPIGARALIDVQFVGLALALNPGGGIGENAAALAQERLRDMAKAMRVAKPKILAQNPDFKKQVENDQELRLRYNLKPGDPIPDSVFIHEAELFQFRTIKYIEGLLTGVLRASEIAKIIESDDKESKQRVRDYTNSMDSRGGLDTMTFIASLNNYGPGSLIPRYADIMEQMRIENGGYIEADAYKDDLRRRVIEEQYDMAIRGVGRYAAFVKKDGNGKITSESEKEVRDAITVDANLAKLIFIITGQASSIAGRGEIPPEGSSAFLDFQPRPFWNQELTDGLRYGDIPKDGLHVLDRFKDEACVQFLKEQYGDTAEGRAAIDAILRDPVRRKAYVEQNGFYKLAPPASFFWDNRTVRNRKILDVARLYAFDAYDWYHHTSGTNDEKIKKERDMYSRGFGLFVQLQTADIIYSEGEPKPKNPEDRPKDGDYYDHSISQDEKGKERDTFHKREYIWKEKIADIFPEVPMEILFNYPDPKNGLDPRFIKFFTGSSSSFLDNLPDLTTEELAKIEAKSPKERAAKIRYAKFKKYVQPVISHIRSQNINSWPPRQTNFGKDGPYNDFDVFGQGFGAHMQRMMGDMTEFVRTEKARNPLTGRDTTIVHDLAYDPTYDSIYRSPILLDDIPWYMVQGTNPNDPEQRENPYPLDQRLGGNNVLGRWMGDSNFLSDSRTKVVAFIRHFDPNNFEGNIEAIQKAINNHREFNGPDAGMVSEISMLAPYLKMSIPEISEFFGLGNFPLFGKNTEMRRIYKTRFINATDRDELYQMYMVHIRPHLEGKRVAYFDRLLKISRRKRNIRRGLQTIFSLIFAYISETIGATTEVTSEEMKGGTITGK